MPGERRQRLRKGARTPRGFAVKRSRLHKSDHVRVQSSAHPSVREDQSQADDSAGLSARLFRLCPNLRADKVKQLRQRDTRNEDRKNPRINAGKPVGCKSFGAEGPEERNTVGLASVHGDVQKRSTK